MVIANDYRTGRSYVMFNYGSINWGSSDWITAAQGYQDSNTFVILDTSYSSLSYSLSTLASNTGKTRETALDH